MQRPCLETPWPTGRSDWQPRAQFASNFTCSLSHYWELWCQCPWPYHPDTNGQKEQVNQEVEQFLRLFMNQYQVNWNEWLAIAEFYQQWLNPHLNVLIPIHAWHQNPWLGMEPLKNHTLETLNKNLLQDDCSDEWSTVCATMALNGATLTPVTEEHTKLIEPLSEPSSQQIHHISHPSKEETST